MWRLGRNMGWHVISIFAMHLDESPMTYGNPSIDAWGRSVDSMQLNKAVWVPLSSLLPISKCILCEWFYY